MAKKHRKRSDEHQRVTSRNAKLRYRLLVPELKILDKRKPVVQDRREWTPQRDVRRLTNGRQVTYQISRSSNQHPLRDPTTAKIAFQDPRKVLVCHRRRKRRESLFASGKAGSGRRITTSRRLTSDSEYSCK